MRVTIQKMNSSEKVQYIPSLAYRVPCQYLNSAINLRQTYFYRFDGYPAAQVVAAFRDQRVLGTGLCNPFWRAWTDLVDEP